MARSSHFPNLGEFRARAARLGMATGAVEEPAAPAAPEHGRAPAPLVMWAVIGLLSVGGLAWVLARSGDPPVASGRTAAAAPAALEERLATVESTIAELRRTGAGAGAASAARDLDRRLATIEEAFDPITTGSLPAPRASRSRLLPRDLFAPPAAAGKADAELDLSAAERAPTTPTRDRDPFPVAPTAAPGGPAGPGFALDLGGFADLGALREEWVRLAHENGHILGGLTARTVTYVNTDGTRTFRLIAGPFDDVSETGRLCAELRRAGLACSQTMFVGAPL